jgi:uncharacterized protein (DUF302 family)/uncharacterized membrane protein YidH (DUF202 family)
MQNGGFAALADKIVPALRPQPVELEPWQGHIAKDATRNREPMQKAELRDYLAAERTFLAWVRTDLALIGFGFVVARFGLFLQQLQIFQRGAQASTSGLSLWFGTALIAAGVFVNLSSAWSHIQLVRNLDRGESECNRSLGYAIATAVFLALVGLAMAIYLIAVRGSAVDTHSKNTKEASRAPATLRGIIDNPSNHSVEQTVERLKNLLQSKGVTLFTLVDHSGEAERVGMRMCPTKLLIFGGPKAGTPLMLAAPSVAIDLPLKILVWEDVQGQVWVSYNSTEYLKERDNLPQDLLANIAVVVALVSKASAPQ